MRHNDHPGSFVTHFLHITAVDVDVGREAKDVGEEWTRLEVPKSRESKAGNVRETRNMFGLKAEWK